MGPNSESELEFSSADEWTGRSRTDLSKEFADEEVQMVHMIVGLPAAPMSWRDENEEDNISNLAAFI